MGIEGKYLNIIKARYDQPTANIITLIQKPDKGNIKKGKLQANIVEEHRRKNLQQNFGSTNSAIHQKGSYTMIKWDLYQGHRDGSISASQST